MVSNLEGQLGGYSNRNPNKQSSPSKLRLYNATLYVFPGNEKSIPGINFLINVENAKDRQEINRLGLLILHSDRPQKFVPLIQWPTAPETFARGVFTYSKQVIEHLKDPKTISTIPLYFQHAFNTVTVVSGSPWDKGCDPRAPRAYSQYNDRIDKPRPRVHSTTTLEEVERLILNAVFEAVCASVNGENQPRFESWPTVNDPYTYLPAPYQDVSLDR
jgi:hypothetical protein